MVFTTPRGYNTLLEVDLLYPLPDKPRYPKPKKPTPKPAPIIPPPPPPPPPPPQMMHPDYHDHDNGYDHDPTFTNSRPPFNHDHPEEIWEPPSGWKDDILANINDKPLLDESNSINMSMTMRKSDWPDFHSKPYWNENMNWRNVEEDTKIYLTPPPGYLNVKPNQRKTDYMSNEPNNLKKPIDWTPSIPYDLSFPQSRYHSTLPSGYKSSYYLPRGRSLNVDSREEKEKYGRNFFEFNADDHEDWEYLHHHKDRRDVYQLIETAFNLR